MTCEKIASCGYMYVDVNQREKSNPQIKTVGGDHFTSLYTENYHTGSDTVPSNLPERPEVRDDCWSLTCFKTDGIARSASASPASRNPAVCSICTNRVAGGHRPLLAVLQKNSKSGTPQRYIYRWAQSRWFFWKFITWIDLKLNNKIMKFQVFLGHLCGALSRNFYIFDFPWFPHNNGNHQKFRGYTAPYTWDDGFSTAW